MDVRADDNCRLWTAETGRGEPLVMCHGGPGLWDMSGSLAARLAQRLTVIRWDQRGGGRSERRGPYSVARSAADLDAVLRQRARAAPGKAAPGKAAPGKAALFGHSWGATLALRYALDHPDRVSALAYVCGTGLGWDWREPFYRAISARLAPHRARIEELRAEGQDREVAIVQWSAEFGDGREREHAEEMATPWFGINQDCYTQVWAELERTWREDALVEQCRALEVPVLIIDGGRDLRPRWAVDSLARALPRVTRVVLPDAGHIPWLEEPDEFTRQLLAFLGPALHL
jgi:proline iminopeptidase